MRIEVQDLRIGDEIIVSRFSDLRYLKVLVNPKPKRQQYQGGSRIQYSSLKCSTGNITVRQSTWNSTSPCCTPEHHDEEIYVDLNYKDIWLVKREDTVE